MVMEWPTKVDQTAVRAMCSMLCDLAIERGSRENVSVVIVVLHDVTKLGMRELQRERREKVIKSQRNSEMNRKRGDLTPSHVPERAAFG
mmetsp:Transcript_5849/g.11834  ORF Transcript_5849/g.11834 Transcript_5849/m.11834 type:complete len:89 (+) Transcript_5849:91-357(+)